MDKQYQCFFLIVIVFSVGLISQARALTDGLDVTALNDLYKSLNNPPQLKGWRLVGGDPCEELWTGVSCDGSSVIQLQLEELKLHGYLGGLLHNLHNLKHLDVSFNNILGEIPYGLPPNASHINMAYNNLSQNIPHSLPLMKHLQYLNLSHNSLSGPVGNVFTGLQIKEMDLSYNNFTGDLPSSFGSLKNLTALFLQNNKFTGSVIYLADLPLTDLNIKENEFSGVIPKQFQFIPRLWIWGNRFEVGADYPPWNFPLYIVPIEQNIGRRPTTQPSAVKNFTAVERDVHKRKNLGPRGIACIVGAALVATGTVLLIAIHLNRTRITKVKIFRESNSTLNSPPLSTVRECSSTTPEESPQFLAVGAPPILAPRLVLPSDPIRNEKVSRRSFSSRYKFPVSVKLYTLEELQSATNSFSEENLLGEGSLGSDYRAELLDGQVFTVKNIHMVALSFHEEEQFMDVICLVSQLRHPNIVTLVGYCIEHGQHLIVYDCLGNTSLDDALHSEVHKPLSWGPRLRIALGIARALDYLHSMFTPPVAHSNLKASNILLDEELVPRIIDCGLAVLRPLTSNSVKLKASEMAIDDTGYIAPEHGQPGGDSTKNDIYAFGVLLLELLTGRRPYDSSRPREEQRLVKWASSRLHGWETLEQMVDPGIRKALPSRALSRFADIISLCIQPEKEFRPAMSDVVESLTCLLHMATRAKIGGDGTEVDPFERSFCSADTKFLGSPAMSFFSV